MDWGHPIWLDYYAWLCILVHMRTTLILDERLLERASELTGIRRKTALVRAGLEALIAREAARRLAAPAGAEPGLRTVPRRLLWQSGRLQIICWG